jgi:hypothetical protein
MRSRVWLERADLRSRSRKEGALLLLFVAAIALSFTIPWLKSHHLFYNPPCIFYTVTHVPCLLCGLTRSFIDTAHGNLTAAFEMHLLGPLLFALVAAGGVYHATSLVSGYRVRVMLSPKTRRIATWSVLGVFLVCWAIKLALIRGSW